MRKMVQGTEHEYTLYCRKMGTMGFDPHMMALDLLRDSDLHLAGEFITNGSRVYYDVGHFEVSTAETTNFHDVVVWEKAGEKILDWLRRVMEEKYTGDMKIHAFKNNTSPDGTSYGSHENYCVSPTSRSQGNSSGTSFRISRPASSTRGRGTSSAGSTCSRRWPSSRLRSSAGRRCTIPAS